MGDEKKPNELDYIAAPEGYAAWGDPTGPVWWVVGKLPES